MTVLDFYLVRHGHSWGQAGIDGVPMHRVPMAQRPPGCETGLLEDDWRLTPLGRRQAALLGESLAQTPFDLIFHSPLERARATAQAVLERQPGPVPMFVPRDLMEIGDWGEETPEELHLRAQRVVTVIRERSQEGARVLVAAHAAFNNRLLMALLGLPAPEHLFRFGQDNTGLTRIIFSGEDVPGVPGRKQVRLYCMNDLSHLPAELRAETIDGNMKGLYP
ncbi:MAG: histidine phosphatase family protein [Oscillospiraceae bacterium]|jgi:probable phosphoglycerate mutase|nr:histidine phosphatase family protein [Oscillospiraceae bacterium]